MNGNLFARAVDAFSFLSSRLLCDDSPADVSSGGGALAPTGVSPNSPTLQVPRGGADAPEAPPLAPVLARSTDGSVLRGWFTVAPAVEPGGAFGCTLLANAGDAPRFAGGGALTVICASST